LVAMGFVPPEKLGALQDDGLANAVATLFSALAAGGGAAGFRAELGLPDEDEIKELRKKLAKVKDREERKKAFIEAAGGTESKVRGYDFPVFGDSVVRIRFIYGPQISNLA